MASRILVSNAHIFVVQVYGVDSVKGFCKDTYIFLIVSGVVLGAVAKWIHNTSWGVNSRSLALLSLSSCFKRLLAQVPVIAILHVVHSLVDLSVLNIAVQICLTKCELASSFLHNLHLLIKVGALCYQPSAINISKSDPIRILRIVIQHLLLELSFCDVLFESTFNLDYIVSIVDLSLVTSSLVRFQNDLRVHHLGVRRIDFIWGDFMR